MKTIKTLALLLLSLNAAATVVRFKTDFGNIDIQMYENAAPNTVANFLSYVNDGAYDESIIHRTDAGFNQIKFVQGGEFHIRNGQVAVIPEGDSVDNEFSISNTRATIAMAKIANQPDSATKSFFFNLADNSSLFDSENGGYTVFGEVIAGLDILDMVGSLRTVQETPVINYVPGTVANTNNYVYINDALELTDEFQITEGLSGAWFNPETNGQGFYLEVLPSANTIILAWFTYDATTPDPEVPSTVGDASNRWLTAAGSFDGNVFVGQLLKTGDGLFDDPTAVVNTVVGEVSIVFQDCGHAILSYVLNESGLNNTVDIQRISGANIDFCENLADQANPGIAAQ